MDGGEEQVGKHLDCEIPSLDHWGIGLTDRILRHYLWIKSFKCVYTHRYILAKSLFISMCILYIFYLLINIYILRIYIHTERFLFKSKQHLSYIIYFIPIQIKVASLLHYLLDTYSNQNSVSLIRKDRCRYLLKNLFLRNLFFT